MTVAELIEQLQTQPGDAIVGYNEPEGLTSWWYEIDGLMYHSHENRYTQRPAHTITLGT